MGHQMADDEAGLFCAIFEVLAQWCFRATFLHRLAAVFDDNCWLEIYRLAVCSSSCFYSMDRFMRNRIAKFAYILIRGSENNSAL